MTTQQLFAPQPQTVMDLGQSQQDAIGFPLSLTERYQPRRVEDFIGLERPKTTLANLIRKPRPCGLLFIGPPGVGKTAIAMAFAEQLPGSLHHVSAQKCDVATLDALNDKCAYSPPRGAFWICLIDEADQMTEKAQLQLLSRLDGTAALKPTFGGGFERGTPAPIIWIFTCNGRGENQCEPPSSFAPRFLSRCMITEFPAVEQSYLALYLRHIWTVEGGPECSDEYFEFMADGVGVRDALMRLESDLLAGPRPIKAKTVPPPSAPASVLVIDLAETRSRAARKAWETRRSRLSGKRHH